MPKSLIIALKELYTTYTDRGLLLIMLALPLIIASIIGFALGGLGGGGSDVPIQNVPVGIVNLDEPVEGQEVLYGDIFVDLLLPEEGDGEVGGAGECPLVVEDEAGEVEGVSLTQLTDATLYETEDAARTAVEEGELVAAVIIPADYTARISYGQGNPVEPVTLRLYTDASRPISASVMESVVRGIATQTAAGNIAIEATIDTLTGQAATNPQVGQALQNTGDEAFEVAFSCAFSPVFAPLSLQTQSVSGEETGGVGFNPFVYFGSANAIFFMMFTAQGSAVSILEERRQWTLQRMLTSPTSRLEILGGKLLGTFVICVVQMLLLIAAFTLVGSLAEGAFTLIFGQRFGLLLVVILASAVAGAGLGTLISGLVSTPEQSNVIGGAIIVTMGALGGTFFPVQALEGVPLIGALRYATITYWGVDAFTTLAEGNADIWLNVALLAGLGVVMFAIGLWGFNRQQDV
jgi:ABC-2 type transport system permease protein